VERERQRCLSIHADNMADLSAVRDISLPTAGLSLRELCHDIIEPAATIRWLARAADAEPAQDQQGRLRTIAAAAGQIAAICEHILDWPQQCAGVRLDLLADDAVASARVRYAGTIDIVYQPVVALARPGDIVRILGNVLTNACRAAGPTGRVRLVIDETGGQARVAIADSGNGLGQTVHSGRASLGLEIIGALALKCGGSVQFGVSDLGGLGVTVRLPAQGGTST
jgi:signal transduction histidine kinase